VVQPGAQCQSGRLAYTSATGVNYVCNGASGLVGATGAVGPTGAVGASADPNVVAANLAASS